MKQITAPLNPIRLKPVSPSIKLSNLGTFRRKKTPKQNFQHSKYQGNSSRHRSNERYLLHVRVMEQGYLEYTLPVVGAGGGRECSWLENI